MQALLKASRRVESVRIAIAFPDNLPTLLGAVECLPSLSLIGSHLGRLHTAAQSVVNSRGVVPFNVVDAMGAGQPVVSMQEQDLMADELRLMEKKAIDVQKHRMVSPFLSILLPSRHCGLLPERIEPGNVEDATENSNEWQADSVRRKRKKKMNKHKHSKRRKLTRHKR